MNNARLGGPIALVVLGLVLALAVSDRISGVDLGLIGWILAGAGAAWLVLELVTRRPRTAVTRETTNVADSGHGRVVEREVSQDRI